MSDVSPQLHIYCKDLRDIKDYDRKNLIQLSQTGIAVHIHIEINKDNSITDAVAAPYAYLRGLWPNVTELNKLKEIEWLSPLQETQESL